MFRQTFLLCLNSNRPTPLSWDYLKANNPEFQGVAPLLPSRTGTKVVIIGGWPTATVKKHCFQLNGAFHVPFCSVRSFPQYLQCTRAPFCCSILLLAYCSIKKLGCANAILCKTNRTTELFCTRVFQCIIHWKQPGLTIFKQMVVPSLWRKIVSPGP